MSMRFPLASSVPQRAPRGVRARPACARRRIASGALAGRRTAIGHRSVRAWRRRRGIQSGRIGDGASRGARAGRRRAGRHAGRAVRHRDPPPRREHDERDRSTAQAPGGRLGGAGLHRPRRAGRTRPVLPQRPAARRRVSRAAGAAAMELRRDVRRRRAPGVGQPPRGRPSRRGGRDRGGARHRRRLRRSRAVTCARRTSAPTSSSRGYDFVSHSPYAEDHNGHGTQVAGTIAEATNNGRRRHRPGLRGAADAGPRARLAGRRRRVADRQGHRLRSQPRRPGHQPEPRVHRRHRQGELDPRVDRRDRLRPPQERAGRRGVGQRGPRPALLPGQGEVGRRGRRDDRGRLHGLLLELRPRADAGGPRRRRRLGPAWRSELPPQRPRGRQHLPGDLRQRRVSERTRCSASRRATSAPRCPRRTSARSPR